MKKKFQNIYYLLLVIFFVSCQGNKNPCSLPPAVINDINKLDSLINIPSVQERYRMWMKNSYKESLIFHADNETYRFIFNGSFNGRKVFRIERKGDRYRAIVKVIGNYPDTTWRINEFGISKKIWDNITDSLDLMNFWTHPISDPDKREFLDGYSYSLEGYKPIKDKCTLKNYHEIGRKSGMDTTFISMCNLFWELEPK